MADILRSFVKNPNNGISATVLDFNLIALYHSYVNYMLSTDINITETTYSC